MSRQSEPSANPALRDLLQPMLSRSEVRAENTHIISGNPGLKPDIIVTAPGRSPVVIEAEWMPAANVENEAIDRLGMEVSTVGRPIEAAIALRYSLKVRAANDLHVALRSERLSYCIFTGLPDDFERFPASGWLEGGVKDRATNKVNAKAVARTDAPTLQGFVHGNTEPSAVVYTDEARAYDGLHRTRDVVKHSAAEYVRGMAHTNGMESLWAVMKRGHNGVYHHFSTKHLDRYVQEFADGTTRVRWTRTSKCPAWSAGPTGSA